jgi:CDP-glucose 4,6-dehydratase
VTSDKCYKNSEWCYSYRENDPLGGKDPYSMSKAGAELVAECWRRSYFDHHPHRSKVVSVRAGNVIGGGDYSADRLIPDCVRAALANQPLTIRSPKATRPWQHVLDCLHGYLVAAILAPQLSATADSESFNFGPQDPHDHPVAEVAEAFFQAWKAKTPGVQVAAAEPSLAESVYLSVSIDKAQRLLGWQPVWSFATAVKLTADWYCARHLNDQDMLAFSKSQLTQFTQDALQP